ncbi:MAG TPA: ATP-binding protein [Candidatus Saccharimonadales bacterium]|jgi:PAS domain S-box-containing protein|nr:ATP-binding protein [Candidatus Saccharimonadales bacterium]
MVKAARDPKDNEVRTNEEGVVVSIWRRRQTAETVRATGDQMVSQLAALKAAGKKGLMFTDISALHASDITREARIEAKSLLGIRADAAAVVGKGHVIATAMYISRIAKPNQHSRWFSNRRKALTWLKNETKTRKPRTAISLIAGVIVGLIGVAALAGWQTGNVYLMRFMSTPQPMNPLSAVGLIVMCVGFCSFWAGNLKILKITGLFGVLLGVAVLLPLHIDTILYADRAARVGMRAGIADTAAICFIATGCMAIIARRKERWVRPLEYILSIAVISVALFNIFGQLYAHDYIFGLSDSFVMGFNTAIAFLVAGTGLLLLVIYRQHGDVLGFVTRTGWLIVGALLLVQVGTYAVWSQAITRNQQGSQQQFNSRVEDISSLVDTRLQAYIDALHGFRGLYAASTDVTQADFDAYYKSLDLAKNYPGLRSMVYIAAVKDSDLPAFVKRRRADKSLFPGGNPAFVIQSKSSDPVHYITTYNALVPDSTTIGTDISSTPGRAAIYSNALASGDSYASGTVKFAKTATIAAQDGFFITIPVKTSATARYDGLVNVVFNYADFFPKLLMQDNLVKDLDITVIDAASNEQVYRLDLATGKRTLAREITVPVVNRGWRFGVTARNNFALTPNQTNLPRAIVAAGQVFSLLLLLVFIMQGRARRQALALAESITQDLEYERNAAVAKDERSGAILTSIGDAVFAIDRHERITLFNPSAQQISGFTAAEAIGKPYKDILCFKLEKNDKINDGFIRRALAGHITSMKNHTLLVRKDGSSVAVADSAAPIFNAKRELEGVIIVFRDISKEAELDRAKTEFVSLASHQLRTPLSAVNWYSEMLLNGDAGKMTKTQIGHVREIYQGNQRMVELVNSLLDVSRLDLGKLPNQPTPTSMAELAESLHKELITPITQKKLKFTMNVEAKLPLVIADPKLLRMIVQNLLSNAVKYTPDKGAVTLTMKKGSTVAGKPTFTMTVADTGYGIPKAQQPKIFSKLFRADNVRALDVEGTGLGLYIVQQVITKLHGSIWFDSDENKGTTFHVVLPFDTWNKSEKNATHQ